MAFDAPGRWIRLCALQACLLAAITAAATPTTPVHAAGTASPRVRSTDGVIRRLIDEAASLSRTFRRLLETIEGTDGIVYVESGACGHGVRACLTMTVTRAADYRILRILIDLRQKPRDLMGSIGHELRHAIEVLENRTLVDASTLYLFYSQGSVPNSGTFETRAAIEAGFAVRNEIESAFNASR
ncbi:MAG: hypothetical protein ABI868_13010 [Acidobacteriota bacterium]